MFRFVAIAWDRADPGASAFAQAISTSIGAEADWRNELATDRLHVYSVGSIDGVNQAYRLHQQQGVILGRLFDRRRPGASTGAIRDALAASGDIGSKGQELVARYWGRWVAFLIDAHGSANVLRDPSGALPCFVLHHCGVAIAFSWLEDVLRLFPQIPIPAIDREGLAAFMAFGDLTGHRTAMAGVTQVLAGTRAALSHGSSALCDLVWDAVGIAGRPRDMTPTDAMAALREELDTCVQAWAGCYDKILLRLSGGVDSSILASYAGKGGGGSRVTCLNYHSVGSDSDERDYARLAASRAGMRLIEYERDSSFRLERVLDLALTPFPCNYMGRMASFSDAEIASVLGARAMFTGAGGDQLFFEVRRWWPAADYLRVRGLDLGFPGAAMDAASLGKVSVWSAMRLAIGDLFRRQPPALDQHKHFLLFTDAVRSRAAQPDGFVHPTFFAPSTLPIGKLKQVQQLAGLCGYYDPFMRDKAPEIVTPMLSQPLIELCLSLPTYLLIHGGRGRGLARSAFEDHIPKAIAERRSKGGIDDHVRTVLASNLEFARDLLLDGELVRLGLIDRSATEVALSARNPAVRSNVTEIHICIGIEAWLRRCRSASRAAH